MKRKSIIVIIIAIFIILLALVFLEKNKQISHGKKDGVCVMTDPVGDYFSDPDCVEYFERLKQDAIKNNQNKKEDTLICKNKSGKEMSFKQALAIAQNSPVCMKEGRIKETDSLSRESHYCGAFPDFVAIPLQVDDAQGCDPHCLVNIETYETEINWMCTGLVDKNSQPKEIDKKHITLPQIPQTPYTKIACQKFIDSYSCQEGTMTSEGLMDCDPLYVRTQARCQAFLDGKEDPYGENYGRIEHNLIDDAITSRKIFNTIISFSDDFDFEEGITRPDNKKFYALKPKDFEQYKPADVIFIKNYDKNTCEEQFPHWPHQSCFVTAWDNCDTNTFVYTSSENPRVLKQFKMLQKQTVGCM